MAYGWNRKNHCHLTVARHMRERIQRSLLVVTLREGEERGRAASKKLVDSIEEQVQEQGVVVSVCNRESAT